MKKILIITGSYPGYGGQSTTAYNLMSFLNDNNYNAKVIFITNEISANIDPNNTGNCYRVILKKTFIHKIYHLWRKKNKELLTEYIPTVKRYFFWIRISLKVKLMLFQHKFSPDLVITNVPNYYDWVNKLFKDPLVIVGGNGHLGRLASLGIDAQTFLKNPELAKRHVSNKYLTNFGDSPVIYNSNITKEVYHRLGSKLDNSYVLFFNFAPYAFNSSKPFLQRKYDIAFIASNFTRIVKNPELSKKLFNAFADTNKIAIGKQSNQFNRIPNTETYDLVAQDEVANYLSDSKLLIIPSFYDSSPSILSEAILNGCNVLVSKNIGWSEYLDEQSVVNDFNNVNEWIEKANFLIKNKVDNSRFVAMVADSKKNILNKITTLLN